MPDDRLLVVGTTPDYVAYIREKYPHRALFLTDVSQYTPGSKVMPDERDEIVCELRTTGNVPAALERQLSRRQVRLSGVVGFDCEWLVLAAEIAQNFGLDFPSMASVRLSRDKFQTKRRWLEAGVPCPEAILVRTAGQATEFVRRLGRPVVLKPLSGSGSELTFLCDNVSEVEPLLRRISKGLVERSGRSLYSDAFSDTRGSSVGLTVLAEEMIEGTEYGTDFIVDGENVTVVRLARKVRDRKMPFGTTVAYEVPGRLPSGLSYEWLGHRLHEAAQALGLRRALCMADFILVGNEPVFLELTPRIGGDCLPPLIRQSCGLDTIGLALDFAEKRKTVLPPLEQWQHLVGLRLLAEHPGVITRLDPTGLSEDSRVRELHLRCATGDEIFLPPQDYDSWVLGHVVFSPDSGRGLAAQCEELRQKLIVETELKDDPKLARPFDRGRRTALPADPAA